MHSILGYSEIENTQNIQKKRENFQNSIQEKRIKKNTSTKSKKINAILESIDDDSDVEDNHLNNLLPPPPQLQSRDINSTGSITNTNYTPETSNTQNDSEISQEAFNNLENGMEYRENYYKQYVPYYTTASNSQSLDGEKDLLIEKLNYMIHLLEEQKEEKTGHITEELILYSFLGVFIIFVIDSFARVGKYVR